MKQTVIENANGLWGHYPNINVEVADMNEREKYTRSCFYDINNVVDTPLLGSTITEDSPYTRPFAEYK